MGGVGGHHGQVGGDEPVEEAQKPRRACVDDRLRALPDPGGEVAALGQAQGAVEAPCLGDSAYAVCASVSCDVLVSSGPSGIDRGGICSRAGACGLSRVCLTVCRVCTLRTCSCLPVCLLVHKAA